MSAVMKWKRADVPGRSIGSGNAWERTIPAALLREMRTNPGVTYQLLNPHGEPLEMVPNEVSTLQAACPKPYRIISRKSTGDHRQVWVSSDPGHWERVQDKKKEAK